MPGLPVMHFTVELADGTKLECQPRNPDMVAFDLARAQNKWPGPSDAPFLYQTFLAYQALRRTGQLPASIPSEAGPGFKAFQREAIEIANDALDDESDPTPMDHAPDSS